MDKWFQIADNNSLLIFGLQLNVMKTLKKFILALVLVLMMNGAIVMGQDLKTHQDIKKE